MMATESSRHPKVGVVVLNWNAWPDTLECIESVMRLDYPNFEIILCDNASTDGSVERIRQWLERALCVVPASRKMDEFSVSVQSDRPDIPLKVIETGANLGFAGGNNIGIADALELGCDYAWVLNADTVVHREALSALVKHMQSNPKIGICGSVLCYYDDPDVIQEAGGCAYYPVIGMGRKLASGKPRTGPLDWHRIERQLDYVSGASSFVSRTFVEAVGPMSEDYFLYCEEIDWATRAKGRFGLGLAQDSIVYHKKGVTTGSKSVGKARTPASEYYLWRARHRFTRKFYSYGLPGLAVLGGLGAFAHLLMGRGKNAKAVWAGLSNKSSPPR